MKMDDEIRKKAYALRAINPIIVRFKPRLDSRMSISAATSIECPLRTAMRNDISMCFMAPSMRNYLTSCFCLL